MKTSDNIKEYFERLAMSHKQIAQFYNGDYDEILEAERSSIEYPCLWFETPEIDWEGDDTFTEIYTNSFVVLMQTKPHDREHLKYNLAFTEKIARDLILKMKCDQENEGLEFKISSASMYRIMSQNSDNETGYRVTFKLKPDIDAYNFKDSFDDKFPPGTFPLFSWEITEDNDIKTIELTSEVLPDISDFDFEWKFYDGIEYQVNDEDENPSFNSTGSNFYFELKISLNGFDRYASGHSLEKSPNLLGKSFANRYNPLT